MRVPGLLHFRKISVFLFGRWVWEAPGWLTWTRKRVARGARWLAAHPLRAGLLTLTLAAIGGGTAWYLTRPKPHYVTYTFTEPALTEYNENGISSIKPLTIAFSE